MRPLRNLPLRVIESAFLIVGIAVVAFALLSAGLVGQGAIPASRPERTPALPLPSPTSPISSAELLVNGFNAPADETPFEASPQGNPPVATPTPTTQSIETPSPSIPEPTTEVAEGPRPATRLVIPALGIDAPVVEVPITNRTWDLSSVTYEIAHLGGTANPGENNNMVLSGHVTLKRGAGPFLHLESLEPGDMAIVYAGEQAYTYRVVSKSYVGPTDVSVAYPTSDPILTLLTCTNWDAENRRYLERLVVAAKPVESELGNE